MANGTYYHDGSGWKPTHSRPPLRRPSGATSSGGGGADSGENVTQGIWEGKSAAAFGTSLTWACRNFSGGYLEVVRQRNGLASVSNYGVSGAAMTTGIRTTIRSTDISGSSLVLLECCTNDFKLNVPLGSVGQMGDTDFDTDTFCGAVRDSIEYILTTDPTKHILLITAPQRDKDGYDVNYTNSAGYKLLDYVNALRSIAALYGLPVCDWYRCSGFNVLTLATYTSDGLHPNAAGYVVLGNLTAAAVANMYCGHTASEDAEEDTGGSDDGGDTGNGNTGDTGGSDGNTVTIDGTEYDTSVASGYSHKMILLLSGNHYLYYSNSPFYVENGNTTKPNARLEVFASDAIRSTASGNAFSDGTQLSSSSDLRDMGDGYYSLVATTSRTLNQYVWTDHDLYYWGTEDIAVSATT